MLSNFTKNRDTMITKTLLQNRRIIHVYKGKSYKKVDLFPQIIGHKLGEFAYKKNRSKNHLTKKRRSKKIKKNNGFMNNCKIII